MDLWDTARYMPGKRVEPRLMVMAAWGGTVPHSRLVLTYGEAAEMYARHGDAEWTVEHLIPVIAHELLHGNVTTTSIRMTGRVA